MDLTVAAIPGYFGTMGAEQRTRSGTPRATARPPPTTSATTRSPASRWASPAWSPRWSCRSCSRRSPRARAATARRSSAPAAAAVAVTTVADLVARRAEHARTSGCAPGAARCASARRRRRGRHRRRRDHHDGGGTPDARTDVEATRGGRDLGSGPWRPLAAILGVGLHLLLEPPVHAREPVHVGDPRRAPLERALQPVDRAAAARRRRVRHVRAVRPPGLVGIRPELIAHGRGRSTCCTSTGSTPTRSAGSARSSRC